MTPDDETAADEQTPDVSEAEVDAVPVDSEPLERAEKAIDEAREAVAKVAQTDSIDEEATGAGELPAFAESTFDPDDEG